MSGDDFMVVRALKHIVPEFKSRNSVFEAIDFQIEEESEEQRQRETLKPLNERQDNVLE